MNTEVQEPIDVAEADQTPASNSPSWPLFYRRPELLSAQAHAHWRIKPSDAAFAAASNSVPLMVGEFIAAARHYPIVFAGPQHTPVAVLGVEQSNRFIVDGNWKQGAYVPAYVRRYPFVFAEVGEPAEFALAIDAASPMVVTEGGEGQALFEDGQPSEVTRNALQFCDAFTRESAATHEFVRQLAAENLLIERTANITLPQDRQTTLTGFSVVSPDAFAQLRDEVVVEWHRKGWLALVHAHLQSIDRFADLLAD